MEESKTIYCPNCSRKVATWDGKSTTNIQVKCSKCKKLIVYDVKTKFTRLKNIPSRNTSSGMRFY